MSVSSYDKSSNQPVGVDPPVAAVGAQTPWAAPGGVPPYRLIRSARRSVGLRVDERGLTVRAPLCMPQAQIDDAVRRHADWVQRKLAEHARRAQQSGPAPAANDWASGARLDYLGQPVTLALNPHLAVPVVWPSLPVGSPSATPPAAGSPGAEWVLRLPGDAAPAQVRALAWRAWVAQALIVLRARLDHWSAVMGLRPRSLVLSSARTTWGSAHRNGTIRLNVALLHLDMALIDYVVVHELAHLREMNHSARFWAIVNGVLPDATARRKALRAHRPGAWA